MDVKLPTVAHVQGLTGFLFGAFLLYALYELSGWFYWLTVIVVSSWVVCSVLILVCRVLLLMLEKLLDESGGGDHRTGE